MSDQLVEDLESVKNYLREHGWVQGFFSAPAGQVCLLGAINRALKPDREDPRSYFDRSDNVKNAIQSLMPPDPPFRQAMVTEWNDKPGRTVEQVYEIIDKAIAKASKS